MLAFDNMLSLYKISSIRQFTEKKMLHLKTKNINFKIQIDIYQIFPVFFEEKYNFFLKHCHMVTFYVSSPGIWYTMYICEIILHCNFIINLEKELDTSTYMVLNQPSL